MARLIGSCHSTATEARQSNGKSPGQLVVALAGNANVGTCIEPGDHAYFSLPGKIALYCRAVDAAGASGVYTNVKQYARP